MHQNEQLVRILQSPMQTDTLFFFNYSLPIIQARFNNATIDCPDKYDLHGTPVNYPQGENSLEITRLFTNQSKKWAFIITKYL